MIFGVFCVASALIGLGQTEFRGRVIRQNRKSGFVRGDGLVVFLQLRIEIADEIERVGFIRRDFRDVLKRVDAFFVLGGVFIDEAEVVPAVRIVGKFCDCF